MFRVFYGEGNPRADSAPHHVPGRAFRTDNGAEYTNSTFVEYCNSLRNRRELTVPYTQQQNGPVESGLSREIKAAHAARIEATKLLPDVHLERRREVRDPDGSSLWMESVLWASEGFNRFATTANSGMFSPHEIYFGGQPPMPVLPFCKPAYHRVPRQSKMDRQARPCYFLNSGYNHGSGGFKVMDSGIGRIVHSRGVTWHQPREPLISPFPTVGSGVLQSPPTAEMPDHVHIQPAPAATATPTAAPVPESANTATAPLQPPPRLNFRSRCSGTGARGRRAYAWSHARQNARNEGISPQHRSDVPCRIGARDGEHELPPPDANLPTASASDVPISSTIT